MLPRSITLLAIASFTMTSTLSAADDTSNANLQQRIDALDQQLRILARKAEIAEESAAERAKTAIVTKAGADGFSIGNSDKDDPYSLRLNLLIQADARIWLNDEAAAAQQPNTFLLRRIEPNVYAQLGKYARGRLQASFNTTSGALEVLESWIEVKPVASTAVTIGRVKPIGVEYKQTSSGLNFPERGLTTNLIPAYDVGVSVTREFSTWGSATIGVVNGSPDGATRATDNDDDKDGFVRLSFTPWKGDGPDALKGVNFVFAGTVGYETGVAPTATANNSSLTTGYRTPGQVSVFSYVSTTGTGAFAQGRRERLAPAIEYYYDNSSLLGEYTVSKQQIWRAGERHDIANSAWQILGSWVLTGETKTASGVVPQRAFNPEAGQWGAWELVGRVGELRIDSDAFVGSSSKRLTNPTTAIRKAVSLGVGANWYLTRNLKWANSFDYTRFDGGGGTVTTDRESERVLISRLQFNF